MKPFWLLGPGKCLAFTFLFATIFTIWDRAEKPGCISRGSTRTNREFIRDSTFRWFRYTFLYVFLATFLLHFNRKQLTHVIQDESVEGKR